MKWLRTKETNKFLAFFDIVQHAAGKKGCEFFLDAGDGRDFETETLEGEDLMGWLIPKEKTSAFEKEWLLGDISDDWSDFYVWAVWENTDNPIIHFK